MPKYTITLKYMIDNNIPIWTTEFETNVVAPKYDTLFTASKWSYLKTLFNKKYYFREIGFEVPELFRHYIELGFMEYIDLYKARLKAFSQLSDNPLSNTETDITEETDFEDLPMTALDSNEHLSTRTNRKSKGKARNNATEISLYDEYSRLIHDLDDDFIDQFNDCFMLIY